MKLKEIINNFENVNALVVGDIMLDRYLHGKTERISPEAPVPVINIKRDVYTLGGAANVANNLASLGCLVNMYGVLGQDMERETFLQIAAEKRIYTSFVIFETKPTIVKTRVLSKNQQLLRYDIEDPRDLIKEEEDMLLKKIKMDIKDNDIIIMSDYNKGVLTERVSKEIIQLGKKHGKLTLVDPKPANIARFTGADLVCPNHREAAAITGIPYNFGKVSEMAKSIRNDYKLSSVIITCGSDGMYIHSHDIDTHLPTIAQEVYDVSGAGDTVMAALGAALSSGASLYDAAVIANKAAGIVVGKVGTATVKKNELEAEL